MSEAMHECKYNPGFLRDTLIPQVGVITDIRTRRQDLPGQRPRRRKAV